MKKCLLYLLLLWCSVPLWAQRNSAQFPEPPSTLSGFSLRDTLRKVYNRNPTILSYDNARRRMFGFVDNNSSGLKANKVYCIYGGTFRNHTYGVSATSLDNATMNTEHVVPQSFLTGINSTKAKADIHHLFPTYFVWNSTRSNHPFGEITNAQVTSWQYLEEDANVWTPSNATEENAASRYRDMAGAVDMYMPKADKRGDVARAIMYVYTMYPDATPDNPITSVINLQTMISWHEADPPDAEELTRNDRIQTYQNTRNPYVDWPDIAARAFGVANCSTTPSTQVSALTVSAITANGFTLSWAKGNADRRLITIRPTASTAFTPVNSTTYTGINSRYDLATVYGTGTRMVYYGAGTTAAITGLTAGTSYTITAYEVCSSGPFYRTTTPATSAATTLTCSGTPTVQVSALNAVVTGTTTMSLNWQRGNGNNVVIVARAGSAVNYLPPSGTALTGVNSDFSAATDKGNGNKIVYVGPATGVSLTGLLAGTTYHFRAHEYCSEGSGAPNINAVASPTRSATTASACASPVGVSASLSSDFQTGGSINLTWTAGLGDRRIVIARKNAATTYSPVDGVAPTGVDENFSVATDQGNGNKVVYNGTGTSVEVTGLEPNSTYFFTVVDYCLTGFVYASVSASPRTSASTTVVNDVIISCYLEGSGNNKALEIYNGSGQEINLGTEGYELRVFNNGSSTASTITFPTNAFLDAELAFVVANTSASTTIRGRARLLSGTLNFTGDDAVGLYKNNVLIDLIGNIGCLPSGGAWTAGTLRTNDMTLRRKATSCTGVKADPTGCTFPTLGTEWDFYPLDDLAGLGSHNSSCAGSSTVITTSDPASTSFCVGAGGATLPVPFVVDGSIGAGNVFTAELSDANGSFVNPQSIGSLASTVLSGSVPSILPAGTAPGTGYKLRVRSSQPPATGSITNATLTVASAPGQVANLTATAGNGQVNLSWTVPVSCYTTIMVVARQGNAVTALPNLTATNYTAVNSFGYVNTGNNLPTDEYAMYKNTGSGVTVTNLANGSLYHFRVFVNNGGTEWLAGPQISASPVAPTTGASFRSRDVSPVNTSAGGAWSTASHWEQFNSTINQWQTATTAPDDGADGVVIRSGHRINQTANLAIDQLVVEPNATLSRIGDMSTRTLNIKNGVGDDVVIFGTLLVDGTGTAGGYGTGISFESGATMRIKDGAVVRILNNTGGGGDDYANDDAGFGTRILWENNARFVWALNGVPAMSGKTFFPSTVSTDFPAFEAGVSIGGSLGGSSATTFNGVFSTATGATITFAGTGQKNFRQGIVGGGTMVQSSTGKWVISGVNARLGGPTIQLNTTGMEIASGAYVTMVDNLKAMGGPIVVNGVLDLGSFAIEDAAGGSFSLSLGATGKIRTSNPAGLKSVIGSLRGAGTYTLNNTGAVVEYYGTSPVQVSDLSYYDLQLTGSGAKNFIGATTIGHDLNISGGANVGVSATSPIALTLGGDLTTDGSASFGSSAYQLLGLVLTNNAAHTFTGAGSTIRLASLHNPGIGPSYTGLTIMANTPLELSGGFNLHIGATYDLNLNGNVVGVGGSLMLTDENPGQTLFGTVVLRGVTAGAFQIGNRNGGLPHINLNHLIVDVEDAGASYSISPAATYTWVINGNVTILRSGAGFMPGSQTTMQVKGNLTAYEAIGALKEVVFTTTDSRQVFYPAGLLPKLSAQAGSTELQTLLTNPLKRYVWQDVFPVANRFVDLDKGTGATLTTTAGANTIISGNLSLAGGIGLNNGHTLYMQPQTGGGSFTGIGSAVYGLGTVIKQGSEDLNWTCAHASADAFTLEEGRVVSAPNGTGHNVLSVAGDINLGTGTDIDHATGAPLVLKALGNTTSTLSSGLVSDADGPYLEVSKTGGAELILGSDLNLPRISMTSGHLNAGVHTVSLGNWGWLSGEKNTAQVLGMVTTQRTLTANDSSHFGGVGVMVNTAGSGATLGAVQVVRRTEVTSVSGKSSINRLWDIEPAHQPLAGQQVAVALTFTEAVLNGKDFNTLKLWRKPGATSSWVAATTTSRSRNTTAGTVTVAGITSGFSSWTVSDDNNPLPVELLTFKGAVKNIVGQQTHVLHWTVAQERDLHRYVVERGQEAGVWDSIGMVLARNDAGITAYTSTSALSLGAYYRLKMVDTDGSFRYSHSIYIAQAFEPVLSVVSPFSDKLEVWATGVSSMQVISALGQAQEVTFQTAGADHWAVETTAWPTGMYYLLLSYPDGSCKKLAVLKQ